jgi:hypothetical protein
MTETKMRLREWSDPPQDSVTIDFRDSLRRMFKTKDDWYVKSEIVKKEVLKVMSKKEQSETLEKIFTSKDYREFIDIKKLPELQEKLRKAKIPFCAGKIKVIEEKEKPSVKSCTYDLKSEHILKMITPAPNCTIEESLMLHAPQNMKAISEPNKNAKHRFYDWDNRSFGNQSRVTLSAKYVSILQVMGVDTNCFDTKGTMNANSGHELQRSINDGVKNTIDDKVIERSVNQKESYIIDMGAKFQSQYNLYKNHMQTIVIVKFH